VFVFLFVVKKEGRVFSFFVVLAIAASCALLFLAAV